MESISISDAGYLLFVIPGGVLVWTYKHFTKSAKMGEFEYALWSFIWGVVIFLLEVKVLELTHTDLPNTPTNDPAAFIGSLLGFSLAIATSLAIPIGYIAALLVNRGFFGRTYKFLLKIAKTKSP